MVACWKPCGILYFLESLSTVLFLDVSSCCLRHPFLQSVLSFSIHFLFVVVIFQIIVYFSILFSLFFAPHLPGLVFVEQILYFTCLFIEIVLTIAMNKLCSHLWNPSSFLMTGIGNIHLGASSSILSLMLWTTSRMLVYVMTIQLIAVY